MGVGNNFRFLNPVLHIPTYFIKLSSKPPVNRGLMCFQAQIRFFKQNSCSFNVQDYRNENLAITKYVVLVTMYRWLQTTSRKNPFLLHLWDSLWLLPVCAHMHATACSALENDRKQTAVSQAHYILPTSSQSSTHCLRAFILKKNFAALNMANQNENTLQLVQAWAGLAGKRQLPIKFHSAV